MKKESLNFNSPISIVDINTKSYNKAIDDFEAEIMKQITTFELKHGNLTVKDCQMIFMDVAEKLKK